MKVMVFVQMDPKDETGAMPGDELLAAMGAYNEELVKAGIMLDVGGLKPTSEGTRVAFHGGTTSVVDGPFTDFIGVVDDINPEKGKVRVLVSFFGRETPVELDFLQVARIT